MKNPFFSKNFKQVSLTNTEVKALDVRAAILIEKLGVVRSELSSIKESGTNSSAPLSCELADFLHDFARNQLNSVAAAYRAGDSLKHRLDIAGWALQMASGLTSGRKSCQYQTSGFRIRSLELQLGKHEVVEAAPVAAGARLARELLNSAVLSTKHYFGRVFEYPHTSPELFEKIKVIVDRADEALGPDSAGVKLVSRLNALKAGLVRLLTAA